MKPLLRITNVTLLALAVLLTHAAVTFDTPDDPTVQTEVATVSVREQIRRLPATNVNFDVAWQRNLFTKHRGTLPAPENTGPTVCGLDHNLKLTTTAAVGQNAAAAIINDNDKAPTQNPKVYVLGDPAFRGYTLETVDSYSVVLRHPSGDQIHLQTESSQ
jgi:hypothetical protein